MKIEYINDLKKSYTITDSFRHNNNLLDISGLEPPSKTATVTSYPFMAGQVCTYENYKARTITLSFDIQSDSRNLEKEYRRAVETLSVPGWLYIKTNMVHRKIYCNRSQISSSTKQGTFFQSVVIQFTCDFPLFQDIYEYTALVYGETPLLTDDSQFDCMFSTMSNGVGEFFNNGSYKLEPKIKVKILSIVNDELYFDLKIKNLTANKVMSLVNIDLQSGDELIFDIEKRNITKNDQDVISYISDDTFIDGFYFEVGKNDLQIYASSSALNFTAEIIASDLYVECIY